MALNNPNDISLKVGFDIDKFTQSLNQTNSLLNKWSNSIQGELFKAFAVQRIFDTLKQGVSGAIGTMASFSKEMSQVQALTNASSKEMKLLTDNALNLSGAFKAIDIAKLETEFSRLGFSTDEILQATKTTINLAAATGEDLAKSAQIAGSTLRAFNLDASQMGRVGDIMASAFNKSALGLDNFGEAIKYVAPVAASANISLEQTSALLGVLADNGIKGSMAGTSLRKIISDLGEGAGPVLTKRLEEMAKAGLSGADAMDEVGRTAYASLLILANNTEKVNQATIAYSKANGELEKMAVLMQDNLIGDWNKFSAAIDTTLQKMGAVQGPLRATLNIFTDFIYQISDNKVGLALSHLVKDIQGFALLTNPNYTTGEKQTIFKKLEKDAEDAGVKLKSYMKDYEDVKAMLFGLDTSGPMGPFAAKTQALTPFGDPNAKLKDNPYSHDKAIKASEGRDYTPDELKQTIIPDALKMFAQVQASAQMTGTSLDSMITAFVGLNNKVNFDEALRRTEGFEKGMVKIGTSLKKISLGLTQAFQSMAVGIGEAIGQALSGGNFGAALLSTIGAVAKQFGQMAIAFGIAAIGIEAAITLDNPFAAIAAGIALVALGSAASSQGAALAQSSSGGSSAVQSRQADMKMEITGQLSAKGPDLALVLSKNNYNVQRIGG